MTTPLLDIWVPGLPRPKGSLRPVGKIGQKARLVEQVDPHGIWRNTIRTAAVVQVPALVISAYPGPVTAQVTFYFPAPKKPRHPWPTTRSSGDLDKLCRNVFDALQAKTGAGVIADDSQIITVTATKLYADDRGPGARIRLTPYP